MGFRLEAFQNRFLSEGQRRVDAILSVTAPASAANAVAVTDGARATGSERELVIGLLVDTSGSMAGERIEAVKTAVSGALRALDERASFFVVAFDGVARMVVAPTRATEDGKRDADRAVRNLVAAGGTAMSSALELASSIFVSFPDAIRHAVFLTDGKNESEPKDAVEKALTRAHGLFACDCWGVGTDWQVGEVQAIAGALLGRAQLVPRASGIAAAFATSLARATAKTWKEARLCLWMPRGADLVSLKTVSPVIADLVPRASALLANPREYLTGDWAPDESRDFHLAVDVEVGREGAEMLVARPSMRYQAWDGAAWLDCEDRPLEGRVFASWTRDATLSSRIDRQVAHYTGQGEIAGAIQTGLELWARGDERGATAHLGKAVQLAHVSEAAETSERLARVVEVVDPATGTVRLKARVDKAHAMDLALQSQTSKRARRP